MWKNGSPKIVGRVWERIKEMKSFMGTTNIGHGSFVTHTDPNLLGDA